MALKGLSFLETGQGEVRGKVPPPCPALLECDVGMAGQSELSPYLGCSLCKWHHQLAVGQNWATLLEGHAPRSSNRVQLPFHERGRGEVQEVEGSWGVPLQVTLQVLTKIHRASWPGACLGRSYLWVQDIWVASTRFSSELCGRHS